LHLMFWSNSVIRQFQMADLPSKHQTPGYKLQ
jgi:hypothetical protein